jgi:hypothetical protein
MMRGMRPKTIRQMALEAARQRTPRGLIADVIDDLWRKQPAPMARLVRIHAAPQAAGQGHASTARDPGRARGRTGPFEAAAGCRVRPLFGTREDPGQGYLPRRKIRANKVVCSYP